MTSAGLYRSFLVGRPITRMFSAKHSYEDAVRKLNSLQSNKATLEQILKDNKAGIKCTNIEDMENYLLRTGVTLSNLDELSVIHVAGTKGKGSTSAMCESILRQHGFRTGFYSSPHLVAVRERIRLDGRVVGEDVFASYFHRVYDMLDATKAHEGDMPKYFSFLTVMAFHMFLREKVDVAIIEVGIGGALDATNVLRKVGIVGITALGLDHTAILGGTLEQVAAAKAGVMKPACRAYTAPQPPPAMRVLADVANNVQCTLNVVPNYNEYTFPNGYQTHLQVNLEAYQTNASLAIQLAHGWMRATNTELSKQNTIKKSLSEKVFIHNGNNIDKSDGYKDDIILEVPSETTVGLKECKWPGRYHVVESSYARFYLDGAHTKESMEICAEWFKDSNRSRDNILIFSATGDRNPEVLLKPISEIDFKHIYFVIPTAYKSVNKKSDNYSAVEHKDLIARCHRNSEAWRLLNQGKILPKISVLQSVSDALINIKHNYNNVYSTSVLVTGSLHLVGATLSIIDPNLST